MEFPSTGLVSLHEGYVENNLLRKFMGNPPIIAIIITDEYKRAVTLASRQEAFSGILLSPPHMGSSKLQAF